MNTVLIDGDIVLHKAAFACESLHRRVYLKGEEEYGHVAEFLYKKDLDTWVKKDNIDLNEFIIKEEIEHEPVENALHLCKTILENIQARTQATKSRIFLSASTTFRHRLVDDYKGHRKRRPVLKEEIKDYMLSVHKAEILDDLEADDCLGIYTGIKASIDKDLLMLPGDHYNITHGTRVNVTPSEGALHFYRQVLTGDPTDNIQGLKGVGPKRADKLLYGHTIAGMHTAVCRAYEENYGSYKELDTAARLLWIIRHPDDKEFTGIADIYNTHLKDN